MTSVSDIDECEDGECEGLELCENNVGGFICGCPDGFTEYWGQCVGRCALTQAFWLKH